AEPLERKWSAAAGRDGDGRGLSHTDRRGLRGHASERDRRAADGDRRRRTVERAALPGHLDPVGGGDARADVRRGVRGAGNLVRRIAGITEEPLVGEWPGAGGRDGESA